MNAPVDVLAVMDDLRGTWRDESQIVGRLDSADDLDAVRSAVAELIEAVDRVRMIPSPVGSGHPHGSPEDRAYIEGFMYALRLVREPGFACGLDARLARVRGAA